MCFANALVISQLYSGCLDVKYKAETKHAAQHRTVLRAAHLHIYTHMKNIQMEQI